MQFDNRIKKEIVRKIHRFYEEAFYKIIPEKYREDYKQIYNKCMNIEFIFYICSSMYMLITVIIIALGSVFVFLYQFFRKEFEREISKFISILDILKYSYFIVILLSIIAFCFYIIFLLKKYNIEKDITLKNFNYRNKIYKYIQKKSVISELEKYKIEAFEKVWGDIISSNKNFNIEYISNIIKINIPKIIIIICSTGGSLLLYLVEILKNLDSNIGITTYRDLCINIIIVVLIPTAFLTWINYYVCNQNVFVKGKSLELQRLYINSKYFKISK